MTERVDFYVLDGNGVKQRWTLACRLAEKAYLRDLRVVLASQTAEDAAALDDLLWTFNERSFIPHDVHRPGGAVSAPVQIAVDLESIPAADLLVNLSDGLPLGWQRFARIAEIVDDDEERRRRGRERFKSYRESKLTVETHRLNAGAGA